ncbi:3-hydroxybutyryl-CoA dehydrogenase [Paraburkholderia sediminicola]|uniref:3-hydroxybutyryl-CoA dehydrogenase n=1 Tax=Paraburkholderia sediminicola TaxID=458836 RepID=A0A6J5CR79_9BURK|nr:3-hydroxybutyryl-CoA dehydrogenase [Paraburkholderia sediminicola]CAB3744165.1 3-hydroxybutyryl-CoA dehydrogenase [Paraburkholderia sediminicola]
MEIETVGVVGAGIMGSGIAQVLASSGLSVIMVDRGDTILAHTREKIGQNLAYFVKKEQLTEGQRQEILGRIGTTTSLADLRSADFVIEAASENESIKIGILRELDIIVRQSSIVATNTSSISITRLAASTAHPDRVIGMHFFNPVPRMGLVELIRALNTSDFTHSIAEALVRRIGKTPITVENRPGFAVNRILCPMINEAIFVLSEGIASAQEIDEGMKLGCNHPIGPLALADLIGLDTLLSVLLVFYEGFKDPKYRPAPLLQEMVDAGRLGKKSGIGFFEYSSTTP